MKNSNDNNQKIGAGHASAMFRLGLRELRGALYPDSKVAQQQEYGLYGTRTPGEVAEARRAEEERELEEEPHSKSILAERLERAERRRDDREPPGREPDRER